MAQSKLTLNWSVREDMFTGMLANDQARFEKGVESLSKLGRFYPEVEVLAWQGTAEATRAVWAHEAGKPKDFRRHYAQSTTYFVQLRGLAAKDERAKFLLMIFEGATLVTIADRLPEPVRTAAWDRSYKS